MTLLLRYEWTRVTDKDTQILVTDVISANINKSTEIKNNLCNLTLKNALTKFRDVASPTPSDMIGTYIESSTGDIMFSENDEIRVWAEYAEDADDVTGTWYGDSNLIGAFTVEEYNIKTIEDRAHILLKAVDTAFILFNKIYTFSYGVGNNFTSPGIIRHVARKFGESHDSTVTTFVGTHYDVGTAYAINSKFVSEGGYIKDYRDEAGAPSTALNGGISNSATTITVVSTTGFEGEGTLVIDSEHISYTGTTSTTFTGCTRGIDDTEAVSHSDTTDVYQGFPLILMNKIWKPLFEWIGEVSQTQSINYLSEIQEGGAAFYTRAFMFWIDKNNAPHWIYPDDTIDLSIEVGEEGRRGFNLTKSVFDSVNFVVYNTGEDMYGNGNIYYWYDENSDVAELKMRYQPMTKIIHTLIDEDRGENPSRDTSETDIYKQFPASYNMIPSFLDDSNRFRSIIGQSARTNVTSDATYNDALREAAKYRGLMEATKITSKRSGLRYRGTLVLKGVHVNPGDLIEVTNPWIGLVSQYLRVLEVSYTINNNIFEATLTVQEDEKTEA